MFKAKIFVNYKPSVLDPKATVIHQTLQDLGQTNVSAVTVGKYFELLLSGDRASVEAQVTQVCAEMLTNVNLETYRYTLDEVPA